MTPLRHALRLALAYPAAVVTATALTVGLVMAWVAVSTPAQTAGILQSLPMMLMQGALITAVTALPGWTLAVGLGEPFGERRRRYYVAAGGLTAVFAHGLLAYSTGSGDGLPFGRDLLPVVGASIIGGLAGGWTHWRVAGRHAGAWRR